MNQTTDLHRVVLCAANGKCSGNCRQGKACFGSTNASRDSLRMKRLPEPQGVHQRDGGHSFNSGVVFPIGVDQDDRPPQPPEEEPGYLWPLFVIFVSLCALPFLPRLF